MKNLRTLKGLQVLSKAKLKEINGGESGEGRCLKECSSNSQCGGGCPYCESALPISTGKYCFSTQRDESESGH